MAVQAVSTRRLCGRKMRKFAEQRFTSIRYDLRKGLSSSLERGGPQRTRTALNEEGSPAWNCLRASSSVAEESRHDSTRQGLLCGEELPIGPTCGDGGSKGRLQFHDGNRNSQGSIIVQETNRLTKDNNGEKDTVPAASVRELKSYSLQVGREGASVHIPSASTTSEAIAFLKNRQQQGIIIDSYLFVEVLKQCLKQKDHIAARQVHDCIIQCGMDKNPYVANTLLNVYIRCERLQDARRVFDGLKKRTIATWSIILKACASPLALKWGKELHACIRHAGLESDVRVGTALVQMYAKCACIMEARQVFEKLGTNRNLFTWNVMIGAYAEIGCGLEAYRLFLQIQREGFIPDAVTYVSILNPNASAGALEWVKNVHSHALKAGLESDLRVGNVLVHMYAKSGSIYDARQIFDRLKARDLITWNTIIGAIAESGCGQEAYRLFLQMQREGFIPDAITYVSILNPSATAGALEWVKEVHSHALKAGLESDLRVGNVLVHMFAKSGSIDRARLIFDRLKTRDLITWNMMIGAYAENGCGVEAYRLFLQMNREGFIPDAITYLSILNASGSAGALAWVKEVHSHALKAGLGSDIRVGNAFVHMYAKCGCSTEARQVFDNLTNRDVITSTAMIGAYASSGSIDDARLVFNTTEKRDVIIWNTMIGAYAESGRGVDAYRLFLQMQREGFMPDAITYVSILNASASVGALEWVKNVHSHALKAGLESDLRVGNALVHMYAKSGSIDDARLIFDRLKAKDLITWNTMIGAYAESDCGVEAYRLFLQMQREGFIPDAITYLSILNASASAGAIEWVKEVHSHAVKAGLGSEWRVGNALVHMYAKCGCITEARRVFESLTNRDVITSTAMIGAYASSGSIDDARLVFDRTEKRDVIIWNTMIGAYAKSGRGGEAYRLFLQMQLEGFIPDVVTYVSILNASASAGALEWVKNVHSHALKAGLESDIRVGNVLVHMYAKSGSIDEARLVFDRMEKRDVVTWNIMIGGLAQHGCGHEALELFRKMNADCVEPNGTTFVVVLSACCHSGLLDDGRRLFFAMTEDYGIEPTVVHYTCVVDLLGRAGHLGEAKLFIGDMPVEPVGVTWGALLGACRTYGNVELGELAANELLKLEPQNASAYVLLSNIYAAAGNWEKVSLVRTKMQERGVRKEPGRSWIEVDNKIHDFVVGDASHPEAKGIYTELSKLTEKLKTAGYIPDTHIVLQNVDEEDKELALCSHSEKLAIAYGLMHTPHGKPIRVYKNLRVCSDCHTATKFISKVTGREIIARDGNRFHHFKDGVCSCGDYW